MNTAWRTAAAALSIGSLACGETTGLAVSAGFLVVFTFVGVVLKQLSASIDTALPWATMVIGVVLLVLGVAMVAGFEPVVSLPKLERGGRERTGASMFVFGISYAVASISCALPLFTATVVGTFRRSALASSVAVFVAWHPFVVR